MGASTPMSMESESKKSKPHPHPYGKAWPTGSRPSDCPNIQSWLQLLSPHPNTSVDTKNIEGRLKRNVIPFGYTTESCAGEVEQSNRYSLGFLMLERAMGIEPTPVKHFFIR
jgi:hypothetical protein